MGGKWEDLTGRKYGRLTVVGAATNRPRRDRPGRTIKMWKCVCSCGKAVEVTTDNLKRDEPSCGCRRRENLVSRNKTGNPGRGVSRKGQRGPVKHGHSAHGRVTAEYSTWLGLRGRCRSSSNKDRDTYRDVTVCDRWADPVTGFGNFLVDMGNRPSAQHSIDRIDNTKGYSPDNCRWATKREQALNRTNTRWLSLHGKTQCASDWATELGLDKKLVYGRLARRLPTEQVLFVGNLKDYKKERS
jgi:hypothetical protein